MCYGGGIDRATTDIVKAVCCVMIFLNHFALRRQDISILYPFAFPSIISLYLFFILSSYGVVKSDESKPICSFSIYFKKRIWKILKPFILVNFIAVVLYRIAGIDWIDSDGYATLRINPVVGEIAKGDCGIFDYISMIVGLKQIDAASWFVYVTLLAYLVFYFSKMIVNYRNNRFLFLMIYSLMITITGVIFYKLQLPAHYYRNLWCLPVGVVVALYSDKVEVLKQRFLLYAIIFSLLVIQYFILGEFIHFACGIMTVPMLWIMNRIFRNYTLNNSSILSWMAVLSYPFYLIHTKVLSFEGAYFGYFDMLIPLVITIIMSYIILKLSNCLKLKKSTL